MIRVAHPIFMAFALIVSFSSIATAQQWELGGEFGFGASLDPSITNPTGSAQTGFRARPAASVIYGENLYQYFGGEFRYLFRWGGPTLTSGGAQASMDGYANVITYEILAHLTPRESRFRPFVAAGSGIRVYTGVNQQITNQPLADFAVLRPVTQVEPTISAGAGLKYALGRDLQLRIDFRTYMSPLPNDVIRPVGKSVIHGWSFDFVPMVGISYRF